MFKKGIFKVLLFTIVIGLFSNSANAILVGGQEYTKFLSASTRDTNQRFGYWLSMKKYSTSGFAAINVNETFVDPDFDAFDVDKIFAMGNTSYALSPLVTNGILEVLDETGQKLLSATIINPGTFSTNFYNNVSISGLYNVNSGLWKDLGLIGDVIYSDLAFSHISWNGKDIHAYNGVFNFYRAGTGDTTVPEPATAVLLGTSGLLGMLRRRAKKASKSESAIA